MSHTTPASGKADTRYLSLLSVIACLSVVILHTNNCFWRFSSTEFYWKTANLVESLFYYAVPVFFMISGATLIDYPQRYSTLVFFRKRLTKTLIPFVFWSLAGLAFSIWVLGSVDPATVGKRFLINSVADAQIVTYYWFFPRLFRAYLSIPLLAAVDRTRRKEVFTYLAVAGYLINVLIPFINSYFALELSFPLVIYGAYRYSLYLIVGYLLATYECSKGWTYAIYGGAVAAFLIHMAGTYFGSMEAGTVVRTFKDQIVDVPYAAGVFLFLKRNGNRLMEGIVGKIVDVLKNYTFAIYLLHWFVIQGMKHFLVFDDTSLVYRLGGVLVIAPVCILVAKILRKIPMTKYLVP